MLTTSLRGGTLCLASQGSSLSGAYKKRMKERLCHPEEISEKLPQELRGKHFDAYWQICLELGCTQGENS